MNDTVDTLHGSTKSNAVSAILTACAVFLAMVSIGMAISAASKGLWLTVAVCSVGAVLTLLLEWFRKTVIEKKA